MGKMKPASLDDRLSRLLEQCELLPGQLGRRQAILDEMQSLGLQIDAAYTSFSNNPTTPGAQQLLIRDQSVLQAQIEHLRGEAEGILTQWWEVHRAVGAELAEGARQVPALLQIVENFSRISTPSNSNQRLQVLRLRELLRNALQLLAATPSAEVPRESKEAQGAGGLLTARETAAALGISDNDLPPGQGRPDSLRANPVQPPLS